jgi:putative transposase
MITRTPGHLAGFAYVGLHRYFLTFCTDRRRRIFEDPDAVNVAMEQLRRTADERNFAILAYCFMPDHVHLLIEGTAEHSDCKQFMTTFKQYSGYYYARRFKSKLWQRYGYEHVLRDDERTLDVARYVLANPVRAGLCKSLDEYPYVGSMVYELKSLTEGVFLKSG